MKFSTKIAASIAAIAIIGITATTAMSGSLHSSDSASVPDGFSTLVFSEEFDSDGMPDSTRWRSEIGYLRNGESQYYTSGNNIECRNGVLAIELRNDSAIIDRELYPITSGSITTEGLGHWKYGYIEVRAKVPSALGLWPSIRLLPAEQVYGSWPRSGEIDIMEHVGYTPDKIHFSAHSERFNYIRSTQRRMSATLPDAVGRFHTYALKWTPKELIWFYDNKEQYRLECGEGEDWTTWPFDTEFFLAISLAYGGSWGGAEGVDDASLPQQFEIDYVRVYQ